MKARTILLLLLIINSTAIAEKPTYQTGKLVKVERRLFPITLGDNLTAGFPFYEFQIQVGDLIFLSNYFPKEAKYRPEWHVEDSVEFRVKKKSLFLKRPNGKELELKFLATIPMPDDKSRAAQGPASSTLQTANGTNLEDIGHIVFINRCAKCHDENGEKRLPDGTTLVARLAANDNLEALLANRTKNMNQRESYVLTLYLKSLVNFYRSVHEMPTNKK